MSDTDAIEEAATLEAFNLCCNWLANNGHRAAATALAAFLNGGEAPPPHVEATELGQRPMFTRETSKLAGYTGSQCNICGSFQMVRNGTCEKCESCGQTTGCS